MHLDAALDLAELGWKVFALGPTGHPFPNCRECKETCTTAEDYERCDHLTCHATYAGTTDQDSLERMWVRYPHAIIGIRTGAASGLFVLDFDLHSADKNGKDTFHRLVLDGTLKHTVAAATGGGGRHLYYAHPMNTAVPNDNRGKLGPGCDIKADGGYVVAPPCAKRGKGAYSWVQGCSPWDRALACLPTHTMLTITERDRRPLNLSGKRTTLSNDEIQAAWTDALDRLDFTGPGSRNENLYRAACRGGELISTGARADEITETLEAAGRKAGLTPGEIRQTIRSGLNRGHSDAQKDDDV